jgi:pilus assembly protein Flp/PilA
MKNLFLKLSVTLELLKNSLKNEQGQDLIEYALVVAFIAFAATAGMHAMATSINAAFTTLGTDLTTAVA